MEKTILTPRTYASWPKVLTSFVYFGSLVGTVFYNSFQVGVLPSDPLLHRCMFLIFVPLFGALVTGKRTTTNVPYLDWVLEMLRPFAWAVLVLIGTSVVLGVIAFFMSGHYLDLVEWWWFWMPAAIISMAYLIYMRTRKHTKTLPTRFL